MTASPTISTISDSLVRRPLTGMLVANCGGPGESSAYCQNGTVPMPKMWNRIHRYSNDPNAGLEAGLHDLQNVIHAD
jgi:hypothetical protein